MRKRRRSVEPYRAEKSFSTGAAIIDLNLIVGQRSSVDWRRARSFAFHRRGRSGRFVIWRMKGREMGGKARR